MADDGGIASLCSYTTILPRTPLWQSALLSAYAPVGVALACLRMTCLCVVACVLLLCHFAASAALLPEEGYDAVCTVVIRILCVCCGLLVRVRSADGSPSSLHHASIIVCNHVTQIDALALRAVTPIHTLVRSTYRDAMWPVRTITTLGFKPIFVPVPGGSSEEEERAARGLVGRQIKERVGTARPAPLLVFPEGSIPNGRGLMRFSKFVFGLDRPVVPVALAVWSPLPLAYDTVFHSLATNVLLTLFRPVHLFRLTVLPPKRSAEGTSAESFAHAVADALAGTLAIPATRHSTADKRDHLREVKAAGKRAYLARLREEEARARAARRGARHAVHSE